MATTNRESLPAEAEPGRELAFEAAVLISSVLAWLGATISSILLNSHSGIPVLLCPVQTGCETVLTSRYSAVLGVPLPWFGIAFYLSMLALILAAYGIGSRHMRSRFLGAALALSVIGVGFSAVLMFIQFFVLHAFCLLCTASAVIAGSLVIASARAERLGEKVDLPGRSAGALALGAFALLSAVPHLLSGTSGHSGMLATVDGQAFTREQMEEELGASLQPMRRSIYTLESEWVRSKVETALLSAAAKKSKTTISDLLAARMTAVKPVSDAEIDAHLASNGLARTPETVERMKNDLLAERRENAKADYLHELARNHRTEIFLKEPEITALKIDLGSAKVVGPPDAKVQLVVFSDFECRHCSDLAAVLKKVRTDFPDNVLVAYRYFPLERHSRAFPAAIAAECAAEQDAFWEYHDGLYAKGSDLSDASFTSIASTLGLDEARFRECQTSARARSAVESSRTDAIASGLNGVPALFLNGKKIGGMVDYKNLANQIRDTLNKPVPAISDSHEKPKTGAKRSN